jgi:hypothetical protein
MSSASGRTEPRRVLIGVLCVAAVAAAFVFTHSGSRATGVCGALGLAPASSAPSLLPPGARCIGGTGSPDIVEFDGAFLLVAPAVFLLGGLVVSLRRRP